MVDDILHSDRDSFCRTSRHEEVMDYVATFLSRFEIFVITNVVPDHKLVD